MRAADEPDSLRTRKVAPRNRIWTVYEPLGHQQAIGAVAAGPVALLAGFSLAALVTSLVEINKSDRTAWADAGAIGFGVAVFALLLSLRLILIAQHWSVSPDALLSWYPEATVSERELEKVRRTQAVHFFTYVRYRDRALRWLPIGTSSALVGLTCLSIHATSGWARVVLPGVLGVAAVVALGELRDRPRFLVPTPRRIQQRLNAEVEAAINAADRARHEERPADDQRAHDVVPKDPKLGEAFTRSAPDEVGLAALMTSLVDDDPDIWSASRIAAFFDRARRHEVGPLARALVTHVRPHFESVRALGDSSLVFLMGTDRLVGIHLGGVSRSGGILVSVDLVNWHSRVADGPALDAALTEFTESPDHAGRWFRFVDDVHQLDALLALLNESSNESDN